MRALAAFLLVSLICASTASAQRAPERAQAMRETARQRVREGRLEEAFELLRTAAQRVSDPTIWLEIGEVADRLRLDAVALQAYEAYLERRADAPDRAEIEGRIRVLREIVAGARYELEERADPSARAAGRDVIVDWDGRPLVLRRSRGRVALASWNGALRHAPQPRPDLLPFPADQRGLGRRLSRP